MPASGGGVSFDRTSSPIACAVAKQLRSHATAAMKYSASLCGDRVVSDPDRCAPGVPPALIPRWDH